MSTALVTTTIETYNVRHFRTRLQAHEHLHSLEFDVVSGHRLPKFRGFESVTRSDQPGLLQKLKISPTYKLNSVVEIFCCCVTVELIVLRFQP